jgi:hypothetical protein
MVLHNHNTLCVLQGLLFHAAFTDVAANASPHPLLSPMAFHPPPRSCCPLGFMCSPTRPVVPYGVACSPVPPTPGVCRTRVLHTSSPCLLALPTRQAIHSTTSKPLKKLFPYSMHRHESRHHNHCFTKIAGRLEQLIVDETSDLSNILEDLSSLDVDISPTRYAGPPKNALVL